MSNLTEIRCPSGPRNLLAKMRADPDAVQRVGAGNLLELSCRDCTRHMRREMGNAGMSTSFRIIHCFDFAGEFVESIQESVRGE